MGNKNETGLFDGESRDVITPSYQSWSVADINTHVPNLDQMLTGNWDLNSIEHENSCSQNFGLNQNQQTAICNHNEQYISQRGGNFGFVLQTDLKLYDGESVSWENLPDVIKSHYIVRDTGLPNFLKARIPVNTNLNIKNWRRYLEDYWDQQILVLLRYGFPLDFVRNCSLQSTHSNHKSAEMHLDQVTNYIKEELSHGVIIGPFDGIPPSFHISPLTYLL